ncbi:MAG: hypothetical protein PF569_06350 [Candidatus Woesearchaeota archaeon]|jgi:hypothetical protein|nr:hypothetical protein [Candidatus Woesearchaeota archaeon]
MSISYFFDKYFQFIVIILVLILFFSFIPKVEDSNSEVFMVEVDNETKVNDDLIIENTSLSLVHMNDLDEDEMYYCFNDNSEVIFESYLSINYFYESFDSKNKNERIFYKNVLYQSIDENDCDWIIQDYNGIYENFKLTFLEYFSDVDYNCEKLDFEESIFFMNGSSLKICEDYFNIYDLEVLDDEI